MFRPAARIAVIASLALASGGRAAEVSKAEFFAQSKDYIAAFQAAATDLQTLIQSGKFKVVAVAEFTDISGDSLHIGRIYAEELSTMLVAPIKRLDPKEKKTGLYGGSNNYRVMDPAAIEEFVRAGGGASLWSSTKKIKAFGNDSDVELVVTGKIEVSNREARFFLKAVETDEASIVWATTISVPGYAAGTEAEAAPLAAPTPALEPQPLAPVIPLESAGASFNQPVDAAKPAPATPTDAAPAANNAAGTVSGAATAVAALVPAAAATLPSPTSSPAPDTTAPASTPTVAAPVAPAVAPALPAEVKTFENGWMRARISSASKYEGSGWVTAVLDVTNLSDRPMFIDVAQDDPGRGIDESGNAWHVERVSGLRLAPNANAGMTQLPAHSMIRVVVMLATNAQPSGKRLSFGPNFLWFGSTAASDSGRLSLAFSNVRVD